MIARIRLSKKDKDCRGEQSVKGGSPNILASSPKKDGESREEFAKRFIDKLTEN